MVLWLRLHAPSAEGLGSIPGHGTRSRISQLEIPYATVESKNPGAAKKKKKSSVLMPLFKSPIFLVSGLRNYSPAGRFFDFTHLLLCLLGYLQGTKGSKESDTTGHTSTCIPASSHNITQLLVYKMNELSI